MKKIGYVLAAVMLATMLPACQSEKASSGAMLESSIVSASEENSTALNLYGEWKQADAGSSWHNAIISKDGMEIYWVSDDGDTTALYWAGTFPSPETAKEPYEWVSENDKEKTTFALLASSDDTKTFTYEKGQISYTASALGTTSVIHLKRIGEVPDGYSYDESDSSIPQETGSTEPAAAKDATIPEQVVLDQDDLKITIKGLEQKGFMGPGLKLLIENNADTDLTVQARNSSVNGYMIESLMSAEVASGKKVNDTLEFYSSDLEACKIETIADMEFSFHIFTTDGWDNYLDTGPIQILTSAAEGYSYQYDDSGELLYEDDTLKIITKGLSENDSLFGPGLILYVENNGSDPMTVQARDVSVNGFMVNTSLSEDIVPGKRAMTALTFMKSSLEENEITEIEEIELSFHIFNSDSWSTSTDTEKITLTF